MLINNIVLTLHDRSGYWDFMDCMHLLTWMYCHVPARWGLQQPPRAPGSEKKRRPYTKAGWAWHITIFLYDWVFSFCALSFRFACTYWPQYIFALNDLPSFFFRCLLLYEWVFSVCDWSVWMIYSKWSVCQLVTNQQSESCVELIVWNCLFKSDWKVQTYYTLNEMRSMTKVLSLPLSLS